MYDKLTNKDIADLKFALEHTDEDSYAEGDEIKLYLNTGGAYRLHCILNAIAPKVVAYFAEQSKCEGCNGTGVKHL